MPQRNHGREQAFIGIPSTRVLQWSGRHFHCLCTTSQKGPQPMPLDCAELEISLHPQSDQICRVELRFSQPGSDADVQLLKAPATIRIDAEHLLSLQLQPDDYGRALTRFLFPKAPEAPDAAVRTAFLKARTAAESQHVPLRIRLRFSTDPSSNASFNLHGLLWETLRDPEREDVYKRQKKRRQRRVG